MAGQAFLESKRTPINSAAHRPASLSLLCSALHALALTLDLQLLVRMRYLLLVLCRTLLPFIHQPASQAYTDLPELPSDTGHPGIFELLEQLFVHRPYPCPHILSGLSVHYLPGDWQSCHKPLYKPGHWKEWSIWVGLTAALTFESLQPVYGKPQANALWRQLPLIRA